jgi:hypothetical protein
LLVFLCTLYVCMYVVFVICIVDLKSYKYAPNLESLLTQQYVCVMCTLWSDNTCIFTRFHSVKNANTQLIWSSVNICNCLSFCIAKLSLLSGKATNTNLMVFRLTRSGLYRNRGRHANHYTTNEFFSLST